MKVALSLSEEARTLYDSNAKGHGMGYMSSRFLADAFEKRGHDLHVVHPSDIHKIGGVLFTKRTFGFKDNRFYQKTANEKLEGDVFFVYSLDEERGPESPRRFMAYLFDMEKQFNLVLNDAESTSYEHKSKQKQLDLPWISGFNIKTRRGLLDLLSSDKKVIAKPKIGACGQGVVFLSKPEDAQKIKDINDFLFEKYVPAEEERRYIFLDDQCIIRRKLRKQGPAGKEICTNVDLMEGNKRELEIARRAIRKTGMFYGAVDFRGDYVLEINGSGTGVAPPTVANELDSYNLSDPIVQAVERRLSRKS